MEPRKAPLRLRSRLGTSARSVLVALVVAAAGGQAQTVSIDFETLPDGTTPYGPVADSYSAWGVTFFQEGIGPQCPGFVKGDLGSDDFFATCFIATYPPGLNIILEFSSPVFSVSADVMSAQGLSVTLNAISRDGRLLASSQSDDSQDYWKGRIEVISQEGITRAEFWPSVPNAVVGIDDLEYRRLSAVEIPTVHTWGLLFLSALLFSAATASLRRRPHRG